MMPWYAVAIIVGIILTFYAVVIWLIFRHGISDGIDVPEQPMWKVTTRAPRDDGDE